MTTAIKKRLRVFAGPNGSGKSTITKIVLDHVHLGTYVNADDLKVVLSRDRFIDFASYGLHNSAGEPNMFAVKSQGEVTILSDYVPKWFETYFINKVEQKA